MNINELIAKLQKIANKNGNCMVELKEVCYDRYGSDIGLVVGDETIMKEYFGGEAPLW